MAFWRLQALHGPLLRGLQRSADLILEAPSSPSPQPGGSKRFEDPNLDVQSPCGDPTWCPEAVPSHEKPLENLGFSLVFQGFSKYWKTALDLAFHLPQEAKKPPMDPILEAKIHPRKPTWRPRALQRLPLGGPKRSTDLNLEA